MMNVLMACRSSCGIILKYGNEFFICGFSQFLVLLSFGFRNCGIFSSKDAIFIPCYDLGLKLFMSFIFTIVWLSIHFL